MQSFKPTNKGSKLSATDFLEIFRTEIFRIFSCMKRYPSSKLAGEIHIYNLKTSVQIDQKFFYVI